LASKFISVQIEALDIAVRSYTPCAEYWMNSLD